MTPGPGRTAAASPRSCSCATRRRQAGQSSLRLGPRAAAAGGYSRRGCVGRRLTTRAARALTSGRMRPAVPGSGWEDFSSLRKKVIHLGTGTSMPSQFLQECHGGFLLRHNTLRMSCVWVIQIATVFHNPLRLTNDSRRKLASGRITNLISTNVESLQQVFLVLVIIREVCFTSRP